MVDLLKTKTLKNAASFARKYHRPFLRITWKSLSTIFSLLGVLVAGGFAVWKTLPVDSQKSLFEDVYFFVQSKPDIRIEKAIYSTNCEEQDKSFSDLMNYVNDSILRDAVEYLSDKGLRVYASQSATGLDRVPPKYTFELSFVCSASTAEISISTITNLEARISLRKGNENVTDVRIPINVEIALAKWVDHESSNRNAVIEAVFDSLDLPDDIASKLNHKDESIRYSAFDMILYRAAASAAEANNLDAAETILKNAIGNNSKFGMAFWALSEIYEMKGDAVKSSEYLEKSRVELDHPRIPLLRNLKNPTSQILRNLKAVKRAKLAEGLHYMRISIADPQVDLYSWDIDTEKYKVLLREAANPKGMSASNFRKDYGAILSVVGGTFERSSSGDMTPSGLFVLDGIETHNIADWNGGGFLLLSDEGVEIIPMQEFNRRKPSLENYYGVLQSNLLIVDPGGVNGIYSEGFALARRAALCLKNRNTVTIVVVDGLMTLFDFGRVLSERASGGGLECERAIYLDGGPSAQASFQFDATNVEVQGGWFIPNALTVVPKTKP